jgi:hypothetical protein
MELHPRTIVWISTLQNFKLIPNCIVAYNPASSSIMPHMSCFISLNLINDHWEDENIQEEAVRKGY